LGVGRIAQIEQKQLNVERSAHVRKMVLGVLPVCR
jgi:hypothetical protein